MDEYEVGVCDACITADAYFYKKTVFYTARATKIDSEGQIA